MTSQPPTFEETIAQAETLGRNARAFELHLQGQPQTLTGPTRKLDEALAAYRTAGHLLYFATRAAFPVGRHVMVTIGRARFEAEITSSGNENAWHYPNRLVLKNCKTGKLRRITAGTSDDYKLELLPITPTQTQEPLL